MQAKKKPAASESSDPSSKLDGAVQSAMAQSEASMALVEASAALEEEEEALARQLGLDSVEELEIALDSLAGIAEDGGTRHIHSGGSCQVGVSRLGKNKW